MQCANWINAVKNKLFFPTAILRFIISAFFLIALPCCERSPNLDLASTLLRNAAGDARVFVSRQSFQGNYKLFTGKELSKPDAQRFAALLTRARAKSRNWNHPLSIGRTFGCIIVGQNRWCLSLELLEARDKSQRWILVDASACNGSNGEDSGFELINEEVDVMLNLLKKYDA